MNSVCRLCQYCVVAYSLNIRWLYMKYKIFLCIKWLIKRTIFCLCKLTFSYSNALTKNILEWIIVWSLVVCGCLFSLCLQIFILPKYGNTCGINNLFIRFLHYYYYYYYKISLKLWLPTALLHFLMFHIFIWSKWCILLTMFSTPV
jgi:hypothetical protein